LAEEGEYYNADRRQCREQSHAASGASSTLRGEGCRRAAPTKSAPTSVHRVGERPSTALDVHAASRPPSGDVEGSTDRPGRSVSDSRGPAVEGRAPGHAGRRAARNRVGGRGARRCGRPTDGSGGGDGTRGTPRARRAATVGNGGGREEVRRRLRASSRDGGAAGACPKRTAGRLGRCLPGWQHRTRLDPPPTACPAAVTRPTLCRGGSRPARGRLVPHSSQSVRS